MTMQSPTCFSKAEWGGFICIGVVYRSIYVQSLAANQMTKKAIGPIRVTRFDSSVTLVGDQSDIFYGRTYGSVGAFADMCPVIMPNGRYRFLVAVGFEHEVIVTNSLPSRVLFRYFSPLASDSILMRLFIIDPFALEVAAEGVIVPASSTDRPLLTDASGTNQFHPQRMCSPVFTVAAGYWCTIRTAAHRMCWHCCMP